MDAKTVIEQIRQWADMLEDGETCTVEGLIAGMREVADDMEREQDQTGLTWEEKEMSKVSKIKAQTLESPR